MAATPLSRAPTRTTPRSLHALRARLAPPTRAVLATQDQQASPSPSPAPRSAAPSAPARPQQRVLPLLASAVEANASLYGYERLAGRSAMVGLAAACVFEAVGGGGVLSSPPGAGVAADPSSSLLSAIALALLGASAAAVASTARSPSALGARWREPVVASLTAVRRANAGVTPSWRLRGLDRAVDEVLRGLRGLDEAADAAGPSSDEDEVQA